MGYDIKMLFGKLIEFEMSAGATEFSQESQQAWDAQSAVGERYTHVAGITVIAGFIKTDCGEKINTAGRKACTDFFEYWFLQC